MTMGDRLCALRKRAGLSQEDLGEIIGVTRQAVQKWEAGSASPDIANLTALCDHFGVTMDFLVRGEGVRETETEPPFVEYRARHYGEYEFTSETRVWGLPLVHINLGFGLRRAKGIIAIGNVATGVVAIGGFSLGILSLGGIAAGMLVFGGVALGLMAALGGLALSLIFSVGGLSVSLGAAIGGMAVGKDIALGGFAVSSRLAIGERATGGLSLTLRELAAMEPEQSVALVRAAYPDIGAWVLRWVRFMANNQ